MTETTDTAGAGANLAANELARLDAKITAARAVLAHLLQDIVVAENRLTNGEASRMLEANEQLLLASLRHQAEADAASQALTEVSRAAELDPLTQLPNRVLLLDRFTRAISTAKRHGGRLAMLFLDLDQFKQVNDSLGHAAGDQVLELVALRLSSTVRDADTVSRHGGDEFLVLLTDVSQPSDAELIAAKLLAALGAPCRVGEQTLQLSASIGIAIYPDDGEDAKTLIERADAAMYRAKRQGRGRYGLHGEAAAEHQAAAHRGHARTHPLGRYEQALAEHERRNDDLREANERLVLAVLNARDLQTVRQG